MSVPVQTPAKVSTANGLTTVFPYDFLILDEADLLVTGTLNGITTPYTLNVDYTISGVEDPAGGNVTFITAPANGTSVLRKRDMAAERETDYQANGNLIASEVNTDYDRAIMLIQQLLETLSRTLTLPAHVTGISAELPAPEPLALFGWNAAANGVTNYPPETFVAAATAGVAHQYNVARGDTTLDVSDIVTPFGIGQVFYNGVFQNPASYAVASGVMTYSEALPADGVVTVIAVFASPDAVTNSEQLFHLLNATGATTRSLRSKLAESVYVEDFGAVGDGVTDDYTAITNAIAYVAGLGGGEVRFADKEYAVGTGVVVSTANVFLQGVGYQKHGNVNAAAASRWTQYGGTILKWIGATGAGDTVLSFKPPVTGPALYGAGYEGILIDCDAKASYGLEILSVQGGRFPRILVADALTRNIHIGVMPVGAWTSVDPRDTQHTKFGLIMSRVWLAASLAADGILIDGDDNADVSVCQFDEVFYIHKDGYGLELKSSDALTFGTVFGFRISGGTGQGIRLIGGASVTDHPRKHFFQFCQPGPGGLHTLDNTVPPTDIVIACYSLGNGTPLPVIPGSGTGLTYRTDTGDVRCNGVSTGLQTHLFFTPVSTGNLGRHQWQGLNTSSAPRGYAGVLIGVIDGTAGSEDGRLAFETVIAGTYASRGYFQDGFVVGAPTGGDKGAGTINLAGLNRLGIQFNGGAGKYFGAGSPEGVVTAAIGSTYMRTDGGAGTSFYVKESGVGSTGWVAK